MVLPSGWEGIEDPPAPPHAQMTRTHPLSEGKQSRQILPTQDSQSCGRAHLSRVHSWRKVLEMHTDK